MGANQWGAGEQENLWDDLLPLCDAMIDFENKTGEDPEPYMREGHTLCELKRVARPGTTGEITCGALKEHLEFVRDCKLDFARTAGDYLKKRADRMGMDVSESAVYVVRDAKRRAA